LEDRERLRHHLQTSPRPVEGFGQEDDDVADSFLAQLEQRTQQVKITLANLEAEKVRIENQIAQLQPVVPHYDALLAAESELSEAQLALDLPRAEAPHEGASKQQYQAPNWKKQHQAGQPATSETWSG